MVVPSVIVDSAEFGIKAQFKGQISHSLDLDLNGLLTRRNFGCIPGMLGTYTIPK